MRDLEEWVGFAEKDLKRLGVRVLSRGFTSWETWTMYRPYRYCTTLGAKEILKQGVVLQDKSLKSTLRVNSTSCRARKENGAQHFNIDNIDSYLDQIIVVKVIKYQEIEVALHLYSSNLNVMACQQVT
jgi:hypothetical protein